MILPALLLLSSPFLLPAIRLPDDPVLRHEISALYNKWNAATAMGEIKTVLAMVHPKFEYFTPEGTQNYRQFCDRVSHAIASSRKMKFGVAIENVEGFGNEAVAWTTYSVSAEFHQGKKWIPFRYKLNLIDTFEKSAKGWLIRSSRVW